MPRPVKALTLISLLLTTLFVNAWGNTPEAGAAPPVPLRWMYYVSGRSLDSLYANASNIDVISPDFYRLKSDGSIRGDNRPDVTNFARAKGIKVVPMIQNDPVQDEFNKVLDSPEKLKNILDTIEKQIFENNYDGYQVDFEDLNSASETLLTNFMKELYNRLHPKGKLVTMAVVSRVSDAQTSQFSAAYNYTALAPYVDIVTVMTYDYHWSGGAPGAVAPVDWQERVMKYAVPRLGAGKVLLGVPFYGYDWNLTKRETDKSARAVSRNYGETLQLQKDNNGIFGYDNVAESPYLDYTTNGEKHQVWFENPRSLEAKFELMKRLQVRGFAAWRLGHEGPEFWPAIKNLIVPTKAVPNPGPNSSYRTYFSQTGHTLQGVFKRYWDRYGGLAQFGLPWTEEFTEFSLSEPGKQYTVQYYERNRFEYHPEFAGSQFEVLLGLLGRQVTAGRENEAPFQRVENPNQPGVNYYPETGHSLSNGFKAYWEKNGGLFIFGFPISQEFQELNPADGKVYTVQYFERNRFEWHPENAGTRYEVLMGLLGNQIMRDKGWF